MPQQAASQPIGGAARAGLREALTELLAGPASAHRVPGAQLAVHLDGVTHAVETGEAARSGSPFTADTAVPVGSVTKPYTATLAMLLVADGDVELDEPLREHLPELRGLSVPLTLRQVLSHTAGLPSGPDSSEVAALTARRYVEAHCTDRVLVMPPGTGFSYSNAGYVVAGRLIETVTGMTWAEAMRTLVLRPLGTRPAFLGDDASDRPVTVGHSVHPDTGRVRPVRQVLSGAEAAAGALLASATDLVALGLAHLGAAAGPSSSGLLPAAVAEEMRRPVPQADPCGLADGWAPGFALFRQGSTAWFGHDGNALGTACHLRADPATGTVVAFTSNAGNGTRLWHEIADGLGPILGVPVPGAVAWHPGPPVPPPEGCAGTYANGDTVYQVVEGPGGDLAVSVDGDPPTTLVCYADLRCSLVDPESGRLVPAGRFLTDARTGAIDRLLLTGRMGRRTDHPDRHA
ncbi:serine hydrolase domain-containing protein [Streptomyces sp.]|uniref:serine hydrolase domain-containing protein n=1 Tax=Streptomyces sp. TaxID=1931 RepID=UPI002F41DC4E